MVPLTGYQAIEVLNCRQCDTIAIKNENNSFLISYIISLNVCPSFEELPIKKDAQSTLTQAFLSGTY